LLDGSIVRRDVVERAGYPRTDFFMMFEDVEYTTRIARCGYQLRVRPTTETTALHLGSVSGFRAYYHTRNHLRVAIDRRSGTLLFGFVCRLVALTVADLRSQQWDKLALHWRGTWAALLGRTGHVAGLP
jgi:GT2 family glycosyltransferase